MFVRLDILENNLFLKNVKSREFVFEVKEVRLKFAS